MRPSEVDRIQVMNTWFKKLGTYWIIIKTYVSDRRKGHGRKVQPLVTQGKGCSWGVSVSG